MYIFLNTYFLIKCVNVFKNCLKNNFLCLGLLVLVSSWELSFYSYCTNTDRHGQTQQGEWWKNKSGKEEENGKEQKKVGLSCAWFPECQHPLLVLQLPGLKLLTLRPYNLPWATLEHRPLQHSVCVQCLFTSARKHGEWSHSHRGQQRSALITPPWIISALDSGMEGNDENKKRELQCLSASGVNVCVCVLYEAHMRGEDGEHASRLPMIWRPQMERRGCSVVSLSARFTFGRGAIIIHQP